jgi:hypothetical protein
MPQVPQDVWDVIRDLQDQIRQLAGRANIRPALTQIQGGDVSIGQGGRLIVTTPGGSQILYIGKQSPSHSDGSDQQGLVVRREDGSAAVTVWSAAGGTQPVTVWDRAGNAILADDVITGLGLARPYLPYPSPTDETITNWPKTTAGSWTTISRSRGIIQHPKLTVRIDMATDGGTTGQIRFSIDGNVLVTASAGSGILTTVSVPAYAWSHDSEFTIDAQRLSGSGSVYAMTRYLYGVQS